ncbi:polysaccharide pyruvyl transferase [Nitzschia inconspicua]|uniref:Polysaccharide pyruvyl transferase n=1 Tax=Nitzschia inconspicua TaxID=303405 RepID=A0A9K3KI84_9STRA|nr:polysaccharide pyruvyl transferase [Nitzschia inconspicua]KAG7343569.1 polysaccharide pyruvyl transferase [Nitzschia inconspicua]
MVSTTKTTKSPALPQTAAVTTSSRRTSHNFPARLRQTFVTISFLSFICAYVINTRLFTSNDEWQMLAVFSEPILNDAYNYNKDNNNNNDNDDIPPPIRHSILTRFMIGQGNQPVLARARFLLFKAFCYPTILHQTSQNFLWLVVTDASIPPDVLHDMTFLLQNIPAQNAYLILTNNTDWASDGISVHNKNGTGYGVNVQTIAEEFHRQRLDIRTGNTYSLVKMLTDHYHHHHHNNNNNNEDHDTRKSSLSNWNEQVHSQVGRDAKLIMIETLLDADDGLHRLAIEYMQKDIWKRTDRQQQQQQQIITPTLNTTWWILCASEHLEWHNRDIFHITADQFVQRGISDGVVGRRETPTECISAGFTRVGYLDVTQPTTGTDRFHFPKDALYNHFQVHKFLQPCQNETHVHCYFRSFPTFPGAIRSRSITSDSMSHLDPDVSLNKTHRHAALYTNESEILWEMLDQDFFIPRRQVHELSEHLYRKRESILHENEQARCIPGFPCLGHSQNTINKLKQLIVQPASRNQTQFAPKDTVIVDNSNTKVMDDISSDDISTLSTTTSNILLLQPKTIPLYDTDKPAIQIRHRCIERIRQRQKNVIGDIGLSFRNFTTSGQKLWLINPAYDANVGNHMTTLGEIELLRRLGVNVTVEMDQCGQSWQDVIPDCETLPWWNKKSYQAGGTLAVLHGGGNWGDIWRRNQDLRIRSLETFLKKNFTIVGMPQSLDYQSNKLKKQDAQQIEAIFSSYINGTLVARPRFLWRDQDSYDEAVKLYPSAQNALIPDITFQLGPYDTPKVKTSQAVDIVVFLRDDRESVELNNRNVESVQSILSTVVGEENAMSTTFKIVDWKDRLEIFDDNNILFTETAIQLISLGRVLVCDRLHAAILAYLSGIPFIYIDQFTGKLRKSLDTALGSDSVCLDGQKSNFARAANLTQGLHMAMDFLQRQSFSSK